MSRVYEIIRQKRDGGRLSASQIRQFIKGVTDGSIPDYQAAALLMAVFLRGLDDKELAVWAEAMEHSGEVVDLSSVPGIKVDKHSTGGVGDKVSLALAPLVAAAGVPVPMISGRGLGHTGGTLDKLEAIPGFTVQLGVEDFVRQVRRIGVSMIGQTSELAPADRKLYALRDVTATVESIPLIAASIMSKKLAAGIDALVLDVKVGRGAFMKTEADARQLASTLVRIGLRAGKRVTALLTAMEQPLGLAVGNALETAEAIEILHGKGPSDLVTVTLELGARMLVLGGKARSNNEGRLKLERLIQNGRALAKMRAMIQAQGGDPAVAEDPGLLPRAPLLDAVESPATGMVRGIDAEAIGVAAMMLGAGRARAEDVIDPSVGIVMQKKVGEPVRRGEPLVVVHANSSTSLEKTRPRIVAAFDVGQTAPVALPLVIGEVLE